MRLRHVILTAMATFAVTTSSSWANHPSWTLRVHGAIVESSASSTTVGGHGISTSVNAGGGFGVGAEYRLSRRVGLEFSTLFAALEIGSSVSSRSWTVEHLELSMMPLTFGIPFHFDIGRRADLYLGPTFSVVQYLNISSHGFNDIFSTDLDIESDAAFGAAAGLDLPFGRGKWCFSSGLRYMKANADHQEIDPVIVTLGVAYRF